MAEANYGGFWIRSLAYAADMSILTLALIALAIPFTFMGAAGMGLFSLIAAIGPIAYFAWFTASDRRATFGKQLCGLKVQQADSGEQLSLLRSIARELAKFVSAAVLFIGFLLAAFTQRKQGLHDMLASTVVVRDGQPRIVLAFLVAFGGVGIPVIVIPLMFGAMFTGLMMAMMGGATDETRKSRPVPQMEQKTAPRPQSSTPQAAPKSTATPAPQAAADDPAAVYRKFHDAIVARDVAEMRRWAAAKLGAQMDEGSATENKVAIAMAAGSLPKTYTVAGTELSADGANATLRLAPGSTQGGEKIAGTAKLVKESGAWKVLTYEWTQEWSSGSKPAVAAPKPAAVEPAKPAAAEPVKPAAAEPPKPVAAGVPDVRPAPPAPVAQPRPAPSRSAPVAAKRAAPVLQQSKPPCVYKPVMTDEDIARCR